MTRVAVLCKQVPASGTAGVDPQTGNLLRTGDVLINPADERALKMALGIPQAQISVLTMGPQKAASLLLTAAAYAPHALVHLLDPAFAGSDTHRTAQILTLAMRVLGDFPLVLCGRRAVDGETGQVAPQIAALLNRTFIPDAVSLELQDGALRVVCQNQSGRRCIVAPLPCVVSVSEGAPALTPPSLRGLRLAAKAQVQTMTLAQLGPDAETLQPSPTRVVRTRVCAPPQRSTRRIAQQDAALSEILQALEETAHG
jgi:electron transfer flavoprotein beta subunit